MFTADLPADHALASARLILRRLSRTSGRMMLTATIKRVQVPRIRTILLRSNAHGSQRRRHKDDALAARDSRLAQQRRERLRRGRGSEDVGVVDGLVLLARRFGESGFVAACYAGVVD